jgi:acetyl esterase/lipase
LHLIDQYEIDPKNIIVVGDSAGGGLVMALLIYLRDHSLPLPNSSILISVSSFTSSFLF